MSLNSSCHIFNAIIRECFNYRYNQFQDSPIYVGFLSFNTFLVLRHATKSNISYDIQLGFNGYFK